MKAETFYKILCGILLAIVGFIGSQIYSKNLQIQKDILDIKITLTRIQAEALTKDDVREITIFEIQKFHNDKL